MIGLYIFLGVFAIISYFCLAIKIAFLVGDMTKGTGFDFGYYMITAMCLIALPICILIGIYV